MATWPREFTCSIWNTFSILSTYGHTLSPSRPSSVIKPQKLASTLQSDKWRTGWNLTSQLFQGEPGPRWHHIRGSAASCGPRTFSSDLKFDGHTTELQTLHPKPAPSRAFSVSRWDSDRKPQSRSWLFFVQHLISSPSANPVGSSIHLDLNSDHLSPPTSLPALKATHRPHLGYCKCPALGPRLPPLPSDTSLSKPGRTMGSDHITLSLKLSRRFPPHSEKSGRGHPAPSVPFPSPWPCPALSYSAPAMMAF